MSCKRYTREQIIGFTRADSGSHVVARKNPAPQ